MLNAQTPKAFFTYISKVFNYENGALVLLATPPTITFTEILQLVTNDIDKQDLLMPLILSGVGFLVFYLVFMADFFSGIAAAKRKSETKPFIQSKKLWASFWKFLGVMIILFMLTTFCLMFALLELGIFYSAFLYLIPLVCLAVTLYEFHSIGENIESMYGKKPKYFLLFERISEAADKAIIQKISKLFS